MTKLSYITLPLVLCSSVAQAQTAAELKAQADYEKVLADTEKTKADTAKAKADLEKVLVDTEAAKAKAEVDALTPLKGIPNAGSTLSGPENTAEALLLSRIVTNGIATRVADAVVDAKIVATADVVPLVVIGSVPPSAGQWLSFKTKREALRVRLKEATTDFGSSMSSMAFLPAVGGAIALAGVILPMLKVDTTIAGVKANVEDVELETAVILALSNKGFGADYSDYEIATDQILVDLLKPLSTEYLVAVQALAQFKTITDPSPGQKASGERLATVVGEYLKLESDLATETNGTTLATVINRQRRIDENRAKRPLIYLTTVKVATTAVTKKGFFTGMFGSGAPKLSGVAIADYVILYQNVKARGSVSCFIPDMTPKNLVAIDPKIPLSEAVSCAPLPQPSVKAR
jgi:hypothetical protein